MPRYPNPSSASPSPDIEFRTFDDDAWYSVRLLLLSSGHQLKLMYCHLSDFYDRVFHAKDFRSLEAIQDFRSRFRPASPQLQDSDCGSVTPGTLVCASHSPRDGDVCFYDAIVEAVERKEHSRYKCLCSFMLLSKHGPSEGKMVMKRIESICVVQPTVRVDPKVASFLEIATKHMNRIMPESNANSGGEACSSLDRKIDKCSGKSPQDIDLGGVRKHYMILIENLEKDLQSSSIEDFLQLHTSMSTRACIFPCLPSESYARGAIFVDSEKNLKKLYDFLEDPDQSSYPLEEEKTIKQEAGDPSCPLGN
ncbi:uncharacterized protein LOC116188500 isoform X1 [Punica granatum]|uniref:Uncharacterized protein LOC116188500 isoform X1 n=1 Tax=Punica granatum TaxID=22663 RepID=A0A6P8BSH6_PUNGR|nr:uncharacterized protein LOC116188500 isoform X1 [Punica granatum]